MNIIFHLLTLSLISTYSSIAQPIYYDHITEEISDVPKVIWNKDQLTWKLVNIPSKFKPNDVFDVFDKAFKQWESISIFKFSNINQGESDIKIYFFNEKEHDFGNGALAHAYRPQLDADGKLSSESGDIHFNDNINWSLTQSKGISLYIVALHEIGHSLGLHHNEDIQSIMYPLYIEKGDNYELKDSPIDYVLIKELYIELDRKIFFGTNESPSTTINSKTDSTTTTTKPETDEPETDKPETDKPDADKPTNKPDIPKSNFHCSCWYN